MTKSKKKSITYICLDTNIVIDCAYSRSEKSSPSLLDKILNRCQDNDVMLLVPEVILLEIVPASKKQMEITQRALSEVAKAVDAIAEQGVLRGKALSDLKASIKKTKKAIKNDAEKEVASFKQVALDKDSSVVISITPNAIVEAAKMAISGKKPSKQKETLGSLQNDCLIVAALQEFIESHTESRVVLCSNNTKDFAATEGKSGLHPDIAELMPGLVYYSSPVELLKSELPNSKDEDKAEVEELSDAYTSLVEWNKAQTAARTASLQNAFRGYKDSIVPNEAIASMSSALQSVYSSDAYKTMSELSAKSAATGAGALASSLGTSAWQDAIKTASMNTFVTALQDSLKGVDVSSLVASAYAPSMLDYINSVGLSDWAEDEQEEIDDEDQ